jgi:hypothetical protein
MSKSLGREYFSQFGERWISGAMERVNMPREVADEIWESMCSYGSWAFNLSHSVAYGVVSYWCAYLKAHHPLEFSAATLDSQKDPHQQIEALRELKSEGISYAPVDVNISTDKWGIDRENNRLVGPISNVIGVGPRKQIEILDSRENGTELKPALRKLLERARTPIDSLEPIKDAIRSCDPSSRGIVSLPTPIAGIHPGSVLEMRMTLTRWPRGALRSLVARAWFSSGSGMTRQRSSARSLALSSTGWDPSSSPRPGSTRVCSRSRDGLQRGISG